MKTSLIALLLLVAANAGVSDDSNSDKTAALPNAHAHNDYYHDRPLLDALDHGFCSVEADVFLVGGKFIVGHSIAELKPGRTLRSLYLDPLRDRIARNRGHVFPDGPLFTLMIDVKTSGESAYQLLRTVLAEYDDILTVVKDGRVEQRAVTVIISGNRDWAAARADKERHAGIDGRLSDLESEAPAHLIPLISDNWTRHFKWRGTGPMPDEERMQLKNYVSKAHARGRRIRFWATPENPQVWAELRAAKVDLIGTDDLEKLNNFLKERRN